MTPLTADGIPIHPGMRLYWRFGRGHRAHDIAVCVIAAYHTRATLHLVSHSVKISHLFFHPLPCQPAPPTPARPAPPLTASAPTAAFPQPHPRPPQKPSTSPAP